MFVILNGCFGPDDKLPLFYVFFLFYAPAELFTDCAPSEQNCDNSPSRHIRLLRAQLVEQSSTRFAFVLWFSRSKTSSDRQLRVRFKTKRFERIKAFLRRQLTEAMKPDSRDHGRVVGTQNGWRNDEIDAQAIRCFL